MTLTLTLTMPGTVDVLTAARAEALFLSGIPAGVPLTRGQIGAAVEEAIQRFHGSRGCAAEVAFRYGENPEFAAARMRWTREAVAVAFGPPFPVDHGVRTAPDGHFAG